MARWRYVEKFRGPLRREAWCWDLGLLAWSRELGNNLNSPCEDHQETLHCFQRPRFVQQHRSLGRGSLHLVV